MKFIVKIFFRLYFGVMRLLNLVGEVRENIALKTGIRRKSCFDFKEECFEGPRFITFSFVILTIAITICLIVQIYYGDYQIVPHGSVATDSVDCSLIGVNALKRGGNAVDAVIASAFCLAVVNPHNTGLDANGILMIYSHRTRATPIIIDFNIETNVEINNVPITRFVAGLAFAHLKFGTLPWRELIKPAANLASQGFLVSTQLAQAITKSQVRNLYKNFIAGRNVTLPSLGSTLHQIADIPKEQLEPFILSRPEIRETEAIKSTFNKKYSIYVPDNPSIGPVLLTNLEHINNINFTQDDTTKPEYVYRLAELLQTLYSKFDLENSYHQGTSSNVAAIDMDDLYVSLVTGMYTVFGTQEITPWGYILDVNSTITGNTRLPIIITNKKLVCGRRIVMGTDDLSIASQVIANLLLSDQNGTISIERPRFQMISENLIGVEDSRKVMFDNAVSIYLRSLGQIQSLPEPYRSCNVVEKIRDELSSHSDSRSGGLSYRF